MCTCVAHCWKIFFYQSHDTISRARNIGIRSPPSDNTLLRYTRRTLLPVFLLPVQRWTTECRNSKSAGLLISRPRISIRCGNRDQITLTIIHHIAINTDNYGTHGGIIIFRFFACRYLVVSYLRALCVEMAFMRRYRCKWFHLYFLRQREAHPWKIHKRGE